MVIILILFFFFFFVRMKLFFFPRPNVHTGSYLAYRFSISITSYPTYDGVDVDEFDPQNWNSQHLAYSPVSQSSFFRDYR